MKCVYAFKLSNGRVKIGVSGNLNQRKHSVEVQAQAKVVDTHHTNFYEDAAAYIVESRCLDFFADKCVGGEYFDISFEEACAELDRRELELVDLNIQARIARALCRARDKAVRRIVFAREAGLSAMDVTDWIDLKKLPSVIDIVKIAQAHNISADFLLGLIDKPRPIEAEIRTPADKENARKLNVLCAALRDVLY